MPAFRILVIATIVAGLAPRPALAQERPAVAAAASPSSPDAAAQEPRPARPEDAKIRKSYFAPALDILGFELLLNRYSYYVIDKKIYGVTFATVTHNLTHTWVVDTDPFAVNQFYHPYQGSIFFGAARSAGLHYLGALGYTFAGSLLWEIAGETGPPSINDQITTGFGGTFLGEPLFRMASLLLEGGHGEPRLWRLLGAAAVSPATGFNRLAYGDRFDGVFPSRDPAFFARLRLGGSLNDNVSQQGVSATVPRKEATADFHLTYGLPGKPEYAYTRPFDYFDFQFTAVNTNAFEDIMSRGLLAGARYGYGNAFRGVWGLYGSYDYISPQIFRVSDTALSLGTTGEWQPGRGVTLQGTLLGGIGYGAAGTSHSSSAERDYHYGVTPGGLLAVRVLFGDVASLDTTVRAYQVSGVGSTERRGSEHITRADAALTVRVYGRHTVSLNYVASRRDAAYLNLPDRHQTIGTFSILYGLISDTSFGAVTWRAKAPRGR